jgi:hemoglobin/transferrin/lactoferrin receptor protein
LCFTNNIAVKTALTFLLFYGVFTKSYAVDGDTIKTIFLNNAIVVAAQRSKTNSFERSESIGYLEKSQLLMLSPMNAPQALSYVPGVWMQRTNQGGGSAFVRGLTGYQTLLLVDGIRMNNSTYRSGPNQYLNTIDPLTIERMEVLRGGGSVQYGSDAIGGTIQMISRDPEYSTAGARVSGELYGKYWSSDMEKSTRGQIDFGTEQLAILGGFTYKNIGDTDAGGDLGALSPTGYDELAFDLKARFQVSGRHELVGAYQYLNQSDVPLYHKIITGEYDRYHFNPQRRDLAYLRLISNFQSKLLSEVRYNVSYQNSLEVREKQKNNSKEYVEETDKVNTLGLNVDVISTFTARWNATSGLEYYHDDISSGASSTDMEFGQTTPLRGLYPDGSKYDNLAVFTLHQYQTQKWNFSAGIRYNFVRLQVQDTLFGNTTITPDAMVGNLGMVYKLNEHHHLTGNINSAFRAPNINDVSSFGVADFRYEVPSYDLKPETSWNKEVGYKFRYEDFSGAIHFFHQNLNNLIVNVPSSYQGLDSLDGHKVYQRDNTGKAVMFGGEMELEGRLSRHLFTFANVAYTNGQNISKHEPLRRIPPLFGRLGIRGIFDSGLSIRAEYVFAGQQDRLSGGDIADDRIADGGTPGWTVLNIYAGYRHDLFAVNLGFENLFDTAYRIHGSGIDGVGRSLWVALRLYINQYRND